MQTKNLIKIIKAEASVLTALIDELPNDGDIQFFESDLLLNKIEALSNLANQLSQQIKGIDTIVPAEKKQIIPTSEHNEIRQPIKPEPQPVVYHTEKKAEKKIEETKAKIETIEVQLTEKKEPEIILPKVEVVEQSQTVEIKKDVKKEEPVNDFLNNLEETISNAVEKPEETVKPEASEKIIIPEEPLAKATKQPTEKKPSDNLQTTLAEKYQQESPSVNDMMGGIKKKHDLASKFHHQPITDLKKSIKINDRIRFINELFGKDNQLFEETVARINQSKNLDEALAVVFPKFDWDQENQTTIHFLELVFRRFQTA